MRKPTPLKEVGFRTKKFMEDVTDRREDIVNFYDSRFGNIRVTEIDGEPWFAGRDVAQALGYENPRKAVKDHVRDCDKKMGEQIVTPSIKDN